MRSANILYAMLGLASSLSAQQPDIGAPPGRLVDIGGRKVQMLCSGQGTPTVVLEAGASSFSIDWTFVQQLMAPRNRVCSYDRLGSAWSDPATVSSRATVTRDLHEALNAAGERPPYIMVGASLGGIFVRLYTADYPSEVAGLVLVDPASEDRLFTNFGGQGVLIGSLTVEQMRSTAPIQAVAVPRRKPDTGAPFDKLPPPLFTLRVKLEEKLIASFPDTVTPEIIATTREIERSQLARLLRERADAPHPLGNRPTVVLSRGMDSNAELVATHVGVAKLSENWRHSVVVGSGHEIHLFQPTAVVQAITDVVDAIRGKAKLPPR